MLRCAALLVVICAQLLAGSRNNRFAVLLDEPPAAAQSMRLAAPGVRRSASADAAQRVRAVQTKLEETMRRRGVVVRGATQHVLNAVFVSATAEQAREIQSMNGVRKVVRVRPVKRTMNEALQLIRAAGAWQEVGGFEQAGAGIRIAVLDTGIDHQHSAFQDASLTPPPGFPLGVRSYTNNKVIVARSYVDLLVLFGQPEFSRPDDLSPRDRVGHGTAVAMAAAGGRVTGPAATISGVAPKAFLGNYKIFGSPGVNDFTFDDVIALALEDAFLDGMDIAVLPVGRPAEWSPDDRICGDTGTETCDLRSEAVENAVAAGLTVVVPAGNDGDLSVYGTRFPALTSVQTPGTAPSAITVGATTNAHAFFQSVKVTGGGVPSNLQDIPAFVGDGPILAAPLTAPLRDVGRTEPNSRACSPAGAGTLSGAIAFIDRGECSFAAKIFNVQQGGAAGAIIAQTDTDSIFPMTGLMETAIPAVMIGATDAQGIRQFLSTNPDRPATLDPRLEARDEFGNDIAWFSSRGPSIGQTRIKPELVATGTGLYLATQSYDPNGDMWSADGFTASQGTSFAAPMAAGAAALVFQKNPSFGPAEVKSALVNSVVPRSQLADFDENGVQVPVSVTAAGAGLLNVESAVRSRVTATPATLSFGIAGDPLPTRVLTLRNHGAAPVSLVLTKEPADDRVTLNAAQLTLNPGEAKEVQATLASAPPPGLYEGDVVIRGGPVDLRVPFLYQRSDGIPFTLIPLGGVEFTGNVNELVNAATFSLSVKVVDRYGIPLSGVLTRFLPAARILEASTPTDSLGIAAATADLGPNPGDQEFSAEIDGQPATRVFFPGRAKVRPVISADGVVAAWSGRSDRVLPVAPGSYIEIYGMALSDSTRVFPGSPYKELPPSLAGVSVSFDVPARNISLPGRIYFVSSGQVNVQVPWELEGLNSALLKVSTGPYTESIGNPSFPELYVLQLGKHSPALYQFADPGTGRLVVTALDEGARLVTSANPIGRGRVLVMFANGLGPVDSTPATGEASPVARTTEPATVTIGGRNARVDYAGLAPGSVGQYQVNAAVPPELTPGLHEVVLTIGGVSSRPVPVYVGP